MRLQQIAKILQALDLLNRPQGATLRELSESLGVTERSVYRILEIMQYMGFPLYDEQTPLQKAKRWRIEEGFAKRLPNLSIPSPTLTTREMIALYLAGGGPGPFRGSAIEESLAQAFAKFEAFLPKGILPKLDRFRTLCVSAGGDEKSLEGKEEIIENLTEAMLAGRTCQVTYQSFSAGKQKTYLIDPLYFFEKRGGLYLFVNVPAYGDIRTLAVERIQTLEQTDKAFHYPEDFDPQAKLKEAFDLIYDDPITAKIRVAAPQVKYVLERRFFQRQEIRHLQDGSAEITLKTSGRYDVKRWVLSMGEDAELLEPADLRKEIREEYSRLARKYHSAAPGRSDKKRPPLGTHITSRLHPRCG